MGKDSPTATAPPKCQGLRFPQALFVRSLRNPTRGVAAASTTLPPTRGGSGAGTSDLDQVTIPPWHPGREYNTLSSGTVLKAVQRPARLRLLGGG